MRRNVFLTIMVSVALMMCSCNEDIYDNIKEMVSKEKVYPAGYDQNLVQQGQGGFERVEIELCGAGNRDDSALFLPRAVKTVVEYDGKRVEFKPARSWVEITGLNIPTTYNFKIYTEDEYGNKSVPVTASGKPFTDADKGQLVITGLSFTANTTQAVLTWNPVPPDLYTITEATYRFTDGAGLPQTGNITGNRAVLNGLAAGETTPVELFFKVRPAGIIDTFPLSGNSIDITTMTQVALDGYINSTSPFPATADGKIGNPYYVTNTTPFVISAAAFDFDGVQPGHFIITYGEGNTTYRPAGGDNSGRVYGVDYNANSAIGTPGLVGLGWAAVGEWYAYTVNVQDPGLYKLEYNSASANSGCQATLTLDNLDVLGLIPIANNGNWGNFLWFEPNVSIRLSAGKHKFRWTQRGNNYNFGGLRLTFVEP